MKALDEIRGYISNHNATPKHMADRLLAAVQAVLELHNPVTVYEYDYANGTFAVDEYGERIEVDTLCRECSSETVMEEVESCEYDTAGNCDAVSFPCPTVAAITETLGGAA